MRKKRNGGEDEEGRQEEVEEEKVEAGEPLKEQDNVLGKTITAL